MPAARSRWTCRRSSISSPFRACTAKMPRANTSAQLKPRCTARMASTKCFTSAVSARAFAPTTVRTRYAVLISCSMPTTPRLPRAFSTTPMSVRSRGVMEKCSYCVQRIRHAEINAEREDRAIMDGEILTACQAACPADAILFGDINGVNPTTHAPSKVKQWKDSPLHYALLADLNTEPRTTYLAALHNPNPELLNAER